MQQNCIGFRLLLLTKVSTALGPCHEHLKVMHYLSDVTTRTLEQQARLWAQREDEAVMRRLVAESRLRDVHRSLSNLMSLFDTTQVAIVSAKNDLEAMRPYLAGTDFPADSLPAVKAEGGEYDIVPEAAKNPPWLIQ